MQSGCIINATMCLFKLGMPMSPQKNSVLAWPAWLRVLAVLPALALLWLAVAWANLEAAPW
jgi:hypothetical protein